MKSKSTRLHFPHGSWVTNTDKLHEYMLMLFQGRSALSHAVPKVAHQDVPLNTNLPTTLTAEPYIYPVALLNSNICKGLF